MVTGSRSGALQVYELAGRHPYKMAEVYVPRRRCAPGTFVVAAYHPRPDRTFLPDLPREAPCAVLGGSCRICVDHLRERKTGPEHPLLVIRCLEHGRSSFTVYPPGFAPYGQARMAPLGPDGAPLEGGASGDGPAEVEGGERFRSTVLRASLDAARGRFWDPEALGYQEPRRTTQLRYVEQALGWLGLTGHLGSEERHRQATALGIDTLLLVEASASLGSWRARGQAVARVLAALPEGACLLERLLEAGYLAGLWGVPYLWDEKTRRLRQAMFRTTGPRASEPLM